VDLISDRSNYLFPIAPPRARSLCDNKRKVSILLRPNQTYTPLKFSQNLRRGVARACVTKVWGATPTPTIPLHYGAEEARLRVGKFLSNSEIDQGTHGQEEGHNPFGCEKS
jgi:hypothetical protein